MADGAPLARDARVTAAGTAALLGALLLFTYAYFAGGPSWNENSRFDLVRSLVERGRVDIDPFHHNTGDKAFRDGHHYSDKAPGASFVALPAYAAYRWASHALGKPPPSSVPATLGVGGERVDDAPDYLVNASFRAALYVCNLSTNVLAGAALGIVLFLVLVAAGTPPAQALFATVTLNLGTLVFPYATAFYGHVLAALFLFGAFSLVVWPIATPGGRQLGLAGLLAGLAVATELPSAPVALLFGVVALVRARGRAVWFLVGASAPLLLLAWYQQAAFGHPLRPGYTRVSRDEFARGMSQGLLGVSWPRPGVLLAMLFGRARGLLYLAPVLLLGFIGLARRARGDRHRAGHEGAWPFLLASVVIAYHLLLASGYYMWWGGAALGPRHLIPMLPFLALGLPHAGRWPWLAGSLLAVSVANHLAGTAVGLGAPFGRDVLFGYVYPHLLRGHVPFGPSASNLGHLLGLRGVASLAPLIVVWAVGSLVLLKRVGVAGRA